MVEQQSARTRRILIKHKAVWKAFFKCLYEDPHIFKQRKRESASVLKLRITKDGSSVFILHGSILIALGFVVWLYAESVVTGLDALVYSSATQEEFVRYHGSLEWWRLQQTSLFNPLAALLIAAGVVLIGNAVFWLVRHRIKTIN